MSKPHPPGWLHGLGDVVGEALNHAGIDGNLDRAALFVAVQVNPDGTKALAFDIRGEGHALAEAAGSLAVNRDLPGIIADALASALIKRFRKDEERNQPTTNPN